MIDILLAVYNGEKYLKEQLDSIINQTYKEFNIIIRDDGSTDHSLDIIKEFLKLHPDKATLVEGSPSGSAKNNFFELMNHATSNYVMFCDQDDVWFENKIELTLNKLKEAEQAYGETTPVLCHTDLTVVDENLNTIHPSFYKMQKFDISKTSLNRAMVQNIVTGCTTMINKPLLDLARNTNSEDVIMHDWWLFLIASAFGKVEAVNTPTILYRQHEDNQLGAKNIRWLSSSQMLHSVNSSIKQVSAFLQHFNSLLSPSQTEIVKDYINIKSYPVLKRLLVLRKHQLYKCPLIKKLFQIITIVKA